jgi:hypothetical protein
MGRLITIVASRPASVPAPAADALPSDAERAVTLVTRALQQTTEANPHHTVDRACSVSEVADILGREQPTRDDIVQIVGHGSPGILSLGRVWTDKYDGDEGVYCLDSDPYTYGRLDGCVPPGCTVWLIGCSVGEDRDELSYDGPTLVFGLSRMWSAVVGGAVGYVGPDDFDRDGRFVAIPQGYAPGTSRLATARGRAVSVGTPPPRTIDTSAATRLPAIKRVVSMPALGRLERVANVGRIADETLHAWSAIAVAPVVTPPLAALPEIVFEVEGGGRLELLANGTIMRDTSAKSARYYAPIDQADVGRALRGTISAALQ